MALEDRAGLRLVASADLLRMHLVVPGQRVVPLMPRRSGVLRDRVAHLPAVQTWPALLEMAVVQAVRVDQGVFVRRAGVGWGVRVVHRGAHLSSSQYRAMMSWS